MIPILNYVVSNEQIRLCTANQIKQATYYVQEAERVYDDYAQNRIHCEVRRGRWLIHETQKRNNYNNNNNYFESEGYINISWLMFENIIGITHPFFSHTRHSCFHTQNHNQLQPFITI